MLEEDVAYLNHGGYGAAPKSALAVADDWRRRFEAQPTRFMEEDLFPACYDTLARLADYVGAGANDLAFLGNAIAGMNAVLQSMVLQPGDEIVATDHAYQAIAKCLTAVCTRQGAELKIVELPFPVRDEAEIVDTIAAALGERSRLLVVDHVTSSSAVRMPLEEILSVAAARDIPAVIDGAHGPGNLPLDLSALARAGAAAYVGHCHKWLCAPENAAFLWTRPDWQDRVHPAVIGNLHGEGYREAFIVAGDA